MEYFYHLFVSINLIWYCDELRLVRADNKYSRLLLVQHKPIVAQTKFRSKFTENYSFFIPPVSGASHELSDSTV